MCSMHPGMGTGVDGASSMVTTWMGFPSHKTSWGDGDVGMEMWGWVEMGTLGWGCGDEAALLPCPGLLVPTPNPARGSCCPRRGKSHQFSIQGHLPMAVPRGLCKTEER